MKVLIKDFVNAYKSGTREFDFRGQTGGALTVPGNDARIIGGTFENLHIDNKENIQIEETSVTGAANGVEKVWIIRARGVRMSAVRVTGPGTGVCVQQSADFLLVDSVIRDNVPLPTKPRVQGFFTDKSTKITLLRNSFISNGGVGGTSENHNIYITGATETVTVQGNVIRNACSYGLQMRAGGIVKNNDFLDNPCHMTYGWVRGDGAPSPTPVSGGISGNFFGQTRAMRTADGSPATEPMGVSIVFGTNIHYCRVFQNLFASVTQPGWQPLIMVEHDTRLSPGVAFLEIVGNGYASPAPRIRITRDVRVPIVISSEVPFSEEPTSNVQFSLQTQPKQVALTTTAMRSLGFRNSEIPGSYIGQGNVPQDTGSAKPPVVVPVPTKPDSEKPIVLPPKTLIKLKWSTGVGLEIPHDPGFSVQAEITPPPKKVEFWLDGKLIRTEASPPFFLHGDDGVGPVLTNTPGQLTPGVHEIKVIADGDVKVAQFTVNETKATLESRFQAAGVWPAVQQYVKMLKS